MLRIVEKSVFDIEKEVSSISQKMIKVMTKSWPVELESRKVYTQLHITRTILKNICFFNSKVIVTLVIFVQIGLYCLIPYMFPSVFLIRYVGPRKSRIL